MALIQNTWWVLVLIGVMILIHELGHFWAARLFDVHVETFSIGFGPRLFGFHLGETDIRFSLILFGGYVKMAGEHPGDQAASADPRSVLAKPRWQRLIIAVAGPAMNVVLAVGILTGLYMVRFPRVPEVHSPYVGFVAPDSAAAKAGIQEGDRILQIDDIANPTWDDIQIKELASARKAIDVGVERNGERIVKSVTPVFEEKAGGGDMGWAEQQQIQIAGVISGMDAERAGLKRGDVVLSVNGQATRSLLKLHEVIRQSNGKPVEIEYQRDGRKNLVTVQPKFNEKETPGGRWMIGVQLEPRMVMVQLPFHEALAESVKQNKRYASVIYGFLRGLVERRMSPKSLEGPIGIARLSGEAAREGPSAFLGLMAMVSLNLAIFNLLPIPILDGGVILLLFIEMLMRRDLSLQVKEAVIKVGFVFLMMVVAFVLYNDISKILPPG
jgi:regulator of sigma E protease